MINKKLYIYSIVIETFEKIIMKTYFIIILISSFILFSCGTLSGTLNGTGSVLEGVASDARQLGNVFKY
jgi:hypothetical protein